MDLNIYIYIWNELYSDDWGGISGNIVKLGLGGLSLVIDTVFIVQHFLLYPASRRRQRGIEEEEEEEEEVDISVQSYGGPTIVLRE